MEATNAASEEAAAAAIEAAAAAEEDDVDAQKEAVAQLTALLEESRERNRELGNKLQAGRAKYDALEAELESRNPNSRRNQAKAKQEKFTVECSFKIGGGKNRRRRRRRRPAQEE